MGESECDTDKDRKMLMLLHESAEHVRHERYREN